MARSSAPSEAVPIELEPGEEAVDVDVDRVARGVADTPVALVIAGLAAMAALGLIWQVSIGTPSELVEPPVTTVLAPPTSRATLVKGDVSVFDRPEVNQLANLETLDTAFDMVLTTRDGGAAALVSVDEAGVVSVTELPEATDYVFDPSGQWLAALGHTEFDGGHDVLWAGRAGEPLQSVAVGLNGFAWHETEPGHIAWASPGGDEVETLDLATGLRNVQTIELPTRGRLTGWGDWGVALLTSAARFRSAIVDPGGEVVTEDIPGRFRIESFDRQLLFSGSLDYPLSVDPATGSRSVVHPTRGAYVWAVDIDREGRRLALFLADGGVKGEPFEARLAIWDDSIPTGVTTVDAVRAFSEVAWVDDGTGLLFVQQTPLDGFEGGTIQRRSVSGSLLRTAVPNVFRGREWVAAIAQRET
ncbi:MAG: hypothetical protein AAF467_03230 [Actinomycetota bacterium]